MSKITASLSDLIDEQCSSDDLEILFKEPEMKAHYYRYQTVSTVLKGEYSANASIDFCQSIHDKIADEPAILAAPRPSTTKRYFKAAKFSSGFAIAASVAVATFFSIQTLQVSGEFPSNQESFVQSEDVLSNSLAATSDETINNNLQQNNLEQDELELFNDIFMQQARQSELDSIAPFATRVGGKYVKTIRFSAEQWQKILEQNKIKQQKQTKK